ncbi:MAG: hypothetical protein WB791_07275 [Waddliaceae bacterium]
MKKSRKIAYLIAYERPNGNPLLKSQVYDLLKAIKAKEKNLDITWSLSFL